jgi:hypothetical protein
MNTYDLALWSAVASLSVGGAMFVVRLLRIQRVIRDSRMNTSRFGLFEARDRLVDLVADGELREDDESWRAMYWVANRYLRLDRRRDYFELLRQRVSVQIDLLLNAESRKDYERFVGTLAAKRDGVPNFASATDYINAGMSSMIAQRTSRPAIWLHRNATIPLYVLALVAGYGVTRLRHRVRQALNVQFLRMARDVRAELVAPMSRCQLAGG